jgi:hypothetical protein
MVSLWICISVALFDLRSAGAGAGAAAGADLPDEPLPLPEDGCCDDAPAVGGGAGSEVMRSISVEPDMAAGVVGSRPCASEISGDPAVRVGSDWNGEVLRGGGWIAGSNRQFGFGGWCVLL